MASRSRSSYISLNLEGFDELLKQIEAAGGSINGAVDSAMRQSGEIQQRELKKAMAQAKVSQKLINRMPQFSVEWEGNRCVTRVGYRKGTYNPRNLTDGYKAVFINYGTPRIEPREFIKKAKSKAKAPIKKAQEEALKKIMGRLAK